MSERKKNNTRGFKISQYAFATFMGLLAVKLAPSHVLLPKNALVFTIPDQLSDSFQPWWKNDQTNDSFFKESTFNLKTPWVRYQSHWHTLTRDHFRCKGQGGRAPIMLSDGEYLFDCWGFEHGLPWIQSQEFIEPLLITLLNNLQEELQTKVVIVSGHRCPAHHRFITKGEGSTNDRHLIGAAADFYVKSFEEDPQKVILSLQNIFNQLSEDPKTKLELQNEPYFWKNVFCEIRWRPAGFMNSLDHPEDIGFFELILFQRLERSSIKFIPKESYRLPLF